MEICGIITEMAPKGAISVEMSPEGAISVEMSPKGAMFVREGNEQDIYCMEISMIYKEELTMAKLIITVEGGKITQTLNFLDRNIKDNRYVYGNGNESGIMEDPEKIYSDIPECQRIDDYYSELLDAVNLGRTQVTDIMRRLNEFEKEMDEYVIPKPESEREHAITLNNEDLRVLVEKLDARPVTGDKDIEELIKKLIHSDN